MQNNNRNHGSYCTARMHTDLFLLNIKYSIQVELFWIVISCSAVVGYEHFSGPCFLLLHPEDGGSMDLQNLGILEQHYTVSQPRRPQHESSPP
jgi:hypothetical protein